MPSVRPSADIHTLTRCHVSLNCVYRHSELLVGVSGWLFVSYMSARLEDLGLGMKCSKERCDDVQGKSATYQKFCWGRNAEQSRGVTEGDDNKTRSARGRWR